jgi:hypothetical protein
MSLHLDRALRQIKKGKSESQIKDSLSLHFQGEDEKAFLASELAEYKSLYYETIVIAEEIDVDTLEVIREASEITSRIGNSPEFIDWVSETKEEQFVRPQFIAKDNYDLEVQDYLDNSVGYSKSTHSIKQDLLNRATVTTASGKVFYVDPASRIDINDAIGIAIEDNLTTTMWKLVSGWEEVALDELKEARKLALTNKATIVQG